MSVCHNISYTMSGNGMRRHCLHSPADLSLWDSDPNLLVPPRRLRLYCLVAQTVIFSLLCMSISDPFPHICSRALLATPPAKRLRSSPLTLIVTFSADLPRTRDPLIYFCARGFYCTDDRDENGGGMPLAGTSLSPRFPFNTHRPRHPPLPT